MDKIIFLDIDGVLNSNFWNEAHQREISDGTLIDAEKVALLGELVRTTKAKVVLHSGWRFWFDARLNPTRTEAARLAELLQREGIELYDVTPDLTTEEIRRTRRFSLVKAKEILAWLDAHGETERWIVLDDLDLHDERITERQVRTDQTVGLTRQDVERAERMLDGEDGMVDILRESDDNSLRTAEKKDNAHFFQDIIDLIEMSRTKTASIVDSEITALYWNIGNRIQKEILGNERAEYGKHIMQELACFLKGKYGKGWSE